MSVSLLPWSETAQLVQERGITTDSIPTWGRTEIWHNKKILVAIRHDTGEIVGIDESVYADDGTTLLPDASAVDSNTMNQIIKDLPSMVGSGISEVIKWGIIGLLGFVLIKEMAGRRAAF